MRRNGFFEGAEKLLELWFVSDASCPEADKPVGDQVAIRIRRHGSQDIATCSLVHSQHLYRLLSSICATSTIEYHTCRSYNRVEMNAYIHCRNACIAKQKTSTGFTFINQSINQSQQHFSYAGSTQNTY